MRNQKANVFVKGKGMPILLLHSSMSSKLQWYNLMELLSRNYLAIAVDLYGYGDSPFPDNKENFCLSDEIKLVESLLEDVIPPDDPIHVVGHSYGGAVGLRYAYRREEQNQPSQRRRILSLALFEPVAFHLLPKNEEVRSQIFQQKEIINSFMKNKQYNTAAEYFIDFWSGTGTFRVSRKSFAKLFSKVFKNYPWIFRH